MKNKYDRRKAAVKARLKKKRDYKKEAKYQANPKLVNYREELNKYNRRKGTYGNGDKKDASHRDVDGDGDKEIAGFESQSKNRARKG